MLLRLLQVLWFMLPVVIGGLIHVAIIKLDAFPWLALQPLDAGLTCRGRRVFGDNKTVRGALVMIGATTLIATLLSLAPDSVTQGLAVAPLQTQHPALWGVLLGAGYILGELPNSFIKRQLDIAPGAAAAAGASARLFWVIDQLDSVLGVFLLLSIVWLPDLFFVSIITALALLLHPLVAALMVAMGLKARVG